MVNPCQPYGILHRSGDASDTASGLHCLQPLPLIGAQPASSGLDLDAGEDGHLLAHHVRCDRARRPADQIRAALGEAELHRPAIAVEQRAGVVAMQAHRTPGALEADLLLDALLAQPMPYRFANLA